MKSYMDLDSVTVIPHMIEEISNFKTYIKSYMLKGGRGADGFVGHTKAQKFHFYLMDDGVPTILYKLLCMSSN